MKFEIIEAFSGLGAQAKAFEKLRRKRNDFEYKVVATIEWEIGASFAYDVIHHGKQNLELYSNFSKEDLIASLEPLNLSTDGKNPMKKKTLKRMSIEQLKAIKHSIDNNKNLVDISTVHASDLPRDADLLTYSFPCQDLSISSYWHGNFSGITKGVENRSGLLWEVERILKEYDTINEKKPRFLLMENVSAIHNSIHIGNFLLWKEELEKMGYWSRDFDLDSSNFGIPQNRVRTFMISIYTADLNNTQKMAIKEKIDNADFQHRYQPPSISEFLRLDYSNELYLSEAIESTPNDTDSRKRIGSSSVVLAENDRPNSNLAKTITTKQDRHPNAGIILHGLDLPYKKIPKSPYRNLTPRETFLLMGFEESDFQALIDNNMFISKSRKFLSHSKLLKLSGNSIVVNVLESIFSTVIDINNEIINHSKNVVFFQQKSI